jgi:hypothetical protein
MPEYNEKGTNMAIEAPVSRHRKTNLIILIVVFLGCAAWFGYDGYLNETFMERHTDADGKPDSTLAFNRKSPPFFLAGAVVVGLYLCWIKGKKIVAADTELVISGREKIPYDSIEKIDKTHFESKGLFVISYKGSSGKQVDRKLRDSKHDNLSAILEHLIKEIS